MPRIHDYYENLLNTRHYDTHLEMCDELGIGLDELYTSDLSDEDFY